MSRLRLTNGRKSGSITASWAVIGCPPVVGKPTRSWATRATKEVRKHGVMRLLSAKIDAALSLLCAIGFATTAPVQAQSSHAQPAGHGAAGAHHGVVPANRAHTETPPTFEELRHAKATSENNPADAKLKFAYGEVLRRAGKPKEACRIYLEAAELDPQFYLAYHQMSLICEDNNQLQEALTRLNHLKAERPKDLLLRVAMSELLEKKGDYYRGAHTLVELVYDNAVPEKYLDKVNRRIRFLMSKARDNYAATALTQHEETVDAPPLPLPEGSLNRNFSGSKIREPKTMRSMGHVPVLH